MVSFRKPKQKANYLVGKVTQLGTSNFGIPRGQRTLITSAATRDKRIGEIRRLLEDGESQEVYPEKIDEKFVRDFLVDRQFIMSQKTLDGYRLAANQVLGLAVGFVPSLKESQLKARAYSHEQIVLLAQSADAKLRLPLEICADAGLRASELHTIGTPEDLKESDRKWREDRFLFREPGKRFIVTGKGGLRRQVHLQMELATRLEELLLQKPISILDRTIRIEKRYDILGGQKFSTIFSRHSVAVLGWTTGAHGLRHQYARRRFNELTMQGIPYEDAIAILAQEIGHLTVNQNTLTYLR